MGVVPQRGERRPVPPRGRVVPPVLQRVRRDLPRPLPVRTSLWSFQWDKGKVLPSRGTEAARLSIVQLVGDGRGGGHPSTVLGYYDAPSLTEQKHEIVTWLNPRETIGFNTASLAPAANYCSKKRAMEFTGPGIACDYLDVEGPLHDTWPPVGHKRLFGDLPIARVRPEGQPRRPPAAAHRRTGSNCSWPRTSRTRSQGIWTVTSDKPLDDADRLLADFLPRAFRRPVPARCGKQYVARVADGSRPATASRRRCGGRTGPRSARRTSCTTSSRPASWTTTPSPAGCRTSCGTRCPTSS